MDVPKNQRSPIEDLEPDECWTLAAAQPVGRLAWSSPRGLTVVPVNFVVTGRRVHIRTAAYSALARECDDSPVAFQVDHFDADHRSGWSVLMRGYAHLHFGGADGGDEPDVWPGGNHGLQVLVDVDEVTGRRVG